MQTNYKTTSRYLCLGLLITMACLTKNLHSQTTVCAGDTVYITLAGYRGDIQWQASQDSVTWINLTGATNDTLMVISSGTYYFRAEVTEGTCMPFYSDTTLLIVSQQPTAANAGPDQLVACDSAFTILAGNTPSAGTGLWTVISGSATIVDPSSPTSMITGLTLPDTITLRWTISNPPCSPTSDEVTIITAVCGPPFVCGNQLTITHTTGSVAPETKTVNYGTVLTNLTGTNKCWITQNLGASVQAASPSDTTNAAAGWYWQFNRPQGFKNGSPSPPTPAWTITSINEPSGWLPANDPCTIELGAGWRIPTQTEWHSADANGSWSNVTHTYNSVLKLHAAGLLYGTAGTLYGRGSDGSYWSSTHYSNSSAHYLGLGTGYSYMVYDPKANGYTLRCLQD